MALSEKSFHILDALDRHEIVSQRQLAECSGVSLAQVNYLLKRLLQQGLIKVKNFKRNPRKSGYLYFLTPKGLEVKSQAAVRFLQSRLREYNHLRRVVYQKLAGFEQRVPLRIVFVGPPLVKDFVDSVIRERGLNLVLTGHYHHWKDLRTRDPESFDMALLLDGNSEGVTNISRHLKMDENKLAVLW